MLGLAETMKGTCPLYLVGNPMKLYAGIDSFSKLVADQRNSCWY